MKSKPLMMMIVAGGCGLVAMLGYQEMRAGQSQQKEETIPVLVAIAEVHSGSKLDETNTQFKAYPKSEVPDNAVTSFEQYERRAPITKLAVNDVVLTSMLGEKGQFGASNKIPRGMRVVTIPVTDSMSHSGQLQPGDRVDVLLTFKQRHAELGQVTKSKEILQYIEVFSTDNNRDGTAEQPEKMAKNVSLLVTPEQAPIVPLAKSMGELHLSLRNGNDDQMNETESIDNTSIDEMLAQLTQDRDVRPEHAGLTSDEIRRALSDELRNQLGELNKNKPPVVEAKEVPVVEEEKLWTVRIYEGDKVRIEEVPIDHQVEVKSKATGPDSSKGSDKETASVGWFSKYKKLWTDAKSAKASIPANAG